MFCPPNHRLALWRWRPFWVVCPAPSDRSSRALVPAWRRGGSFAVLRGSRLHRGRVGSDVARVVGTEGWGHGGRDVDRNNFTSPTGPPQDRCPRPQDHQHRVEIGRVTAGLWNLQEHRRTCGYISYFAVQDVNCCFNAFVYKYTVQV